MGVLERTTAWVTWPTPVAGMFSFADVAMPYAVSSWDGASLSARQCNSRVDPFPLCAEALLLFPMHLLQPLLSHYPSAPLIEPVVWPCVARSGRGPVPAMRGSPAVS